MLAAFSEVVIRTYEESAARDEKEEPNPIILSVHLACVR